MADTELKIRVSAQLQDAKAALAELTKQLSTIAQSGAGLGAAATAGFAKMEASAERAAKSAADVAAAATRIGEAIDRMNAKAREPVPTPKVPRSPLAEGIANETAIQKAALKQQLSDLDAAHKAGTLETQAYYEQRAQLQRAALTAEVAAAKAAHDAATTQAARDAAATRAAIAQRQLEAVKVPALKPAVVPIAEGLADQNAVQRAALKQQLAELDANHKAGLVKEKEYYAQRAVIQRAALNAEIAQAKAAYAAATTQAQRNAATTRQSILQAQLSTVSGDVPKSAKQVDALTAVLGRARSAAAQLGLAIGTFAAVKTFIGMADQAKNLEGRIKLVTRSAEEQAIAQSKLFDIAQRTRSDVGSVVDLYARLSTATRELGVSQGELLRATETVSKAIKLSFSGSESATAALIQLGQGLAAGTLRGQELQSVLEQAPRLAQAVAAGMGVTTGKLKALGEAGEITAEQVLNALATQATKIDEEFKKLPLDVSGAFTILQNSLVKASGEFDRTTGVTSTLASGIAALGPIVESVSSRISESLAAASASARTNLEQIGDAFTSTGRQAEESWFAKADRAIATGLAAFFGFIEDSFIHFDANMTALIQPQFVKLIAYVDKLIATAGLLKDTVAAIFTKDTVKGAWEQYNAEWQRAQENMEKGLKEIEDNLLASYQNAEKAVAKIRDMREKDRQRTQQKLKEEGRKPEQYGPPPPPPGVDATEVEKDALRQRLDVIKASYDLALISTEDYYRRRVGIQRRMLEIEIEQEKLAARKATSPDAKAKALTQVAVLEGKRAEIKRQADLEIAEAERSLQEKLADLRVQALAAEGKTVEARTAELDKQYRELIAKFRVEGSSEGVTLVEKIVGIEKGKAELDALNEMAELTAQILEETGNVAEARATQIELRYSEMLERYRRAGDLVNVAKVEMLIDLAKLKSDRELLGEEIDKIVAEFDRIEEGAANAVLTGNLTSAQAFEKVRAAAFNTIPALEAMRAKLVATGDTSKETADTIALVDARIAQLKVRTQGGLEKALADLESQFGRLTQSFASDVSFAFADSLSQFFQDIVTGSKSAGDALRDFASTFARSVLQMMTQLLALKVAKSILGGGVFGGTGLLGLFGGGSSTGASVKHTGGLVGAPGVSRTVPIAAFFGAPRLHSGASLGLRADEVPTILQKGEEVLAKNDPRNVRNQGAGGPSTVQIVLHPDHNHRTMRDWLESELARVAATS